MSIMPSKNSSFINTVAHLPKCKEIYSCIQCGTCSATCPIARYMDYTPRKLFALIRAGMEDEVLTSNTIWYCASCYSCAVRCPMDINITEVMYALKERALKKGKTAKGLVAPHFARAFLKNVSRYGRVFEPGLAPSFICRVGIGGAIDNSLFGMSLFKKGRLPLRPKKIKGLKGFKKILKKANELRAEK